MNVDRLKKINMPEWSVYVVVFIIAVTGFLYMYGIYIINPTYTDWLLEGAHYDLSQHYLGWKAYRNGSWTFPIGYTDNLLYPTRTSVIFTDSIPCFAVLFKLLSPILPAEFQYFGLWGIMCFVLQGILSAKIVSRFTNNKVLIVLSSTLFIFSTCMIRKMYAHTALAGQWIILLALQSVFFYRDYAQNKKIYVLEAVVGVLAASVHIYFLPMCGIILLGYCAADLMAYRRIKRSFLVLVTYLFSAGITIFLLGGGGSGDIAFVADGFRVMSLNLNGLFNPQGWSCIYRDLPLYGEGQYEGVAYLGAGGIFLLFFSFILLISNSQIKKIISNYRCEIIALAVILVCSFVFALSPTITMNDRVVAAFSLPGIIEKYWAVFRSTGRCGWVLFYTLMLCFCIIVCRVVDAKTAVVCLALCAALQIYDIHTELVGLHVSYSQTVVYETVYENRFSDFWEPVGNDENIKHIMFTSPITGVNLYAMTDWALSHGKTINYFYFARKYNDFDDNLEAALASPDETELFLFPEDDRQKCLKYDLNYYHVDDYIIGYVGTFDNWEQLPEDYFE